MPSVSDGDGTSSGWGYGTSSGWGYGDGYGAPEDEEIRQAFTQEDK